MLRLKPKLKHVLLSLFGLLFLLFFIWIWAGIRIGIWTYPQYRRHIWLEEAIPVANALWSHQIKAGDKAAEFSREWRPDLVTRFGPWRDMEWFPGGARDDLRSFIGIEVVAKDGRLVRAAAYSNDGLNNRVFFDTETAGDKGDYNTGFVAFAKRQNAFPAANVPAVQELRDGTTKAGANVEEIVGRLDPNVVVRFGRWELLRWFPETWSGPVHEVYGARIIAKDGVVVYANSDSEIDGLCCTYFDTETPQDKMDFNFAYQKFSAVIQDGERLSIRDISVDPDTSASR